MNDVRIEKVTNGYIIEANGTRQVASNLEEVFNELLLYFEGRARTFHNNSFGKVTIERGQAEK